MGGNNINKFEDMDIWQDARSLSKIVFEITSTDKFMSDYRFKSQIRASSGSIMDNIAEGFERNGNREFVQFLSIAKGSCGELQSQIYRAFDFNYIDEIVKDDLLEKSKSLSNRIAGFMIYLKRSEYKGSKFKS